MATSARPVSGLMPTAPGTSCRAGRTLRIFWPARSTLAIVFVAELTTNAICRWESTATLVGPEAGHGGGVFIAAVQILAIKEGVEEVRSIRVTSFDPLFATMAMPVAWLTATSLGAEEAAEPTAMRVEVG